MQGILLLMGVILLLLPLSTGATWFQGQASIDIEELDIEDARVQAIKLAVVNATLTSGTFVHIEEISLDGLLTSSKTSLQSYGNIRRVEILSEQLEHDRLTVVVNVDVAQTNLCAESKYKKSLLVTFLPLKNVNQATYGQIYNFGQHVTQRLASSLANQSNLHLIGTTERPLISALDHRHLQTTNWQERAQFLHQEHGAQLILFGYVRDISLFSQEKEGLILDDVKIRRNFTLELVLYDAVEQQVVMNRSFHDEGNWPYLDNYNADQKKSVCRRAE